jgi:predicted MFS family arabinose efflux permease
VNGISRIAVFGAGIVAGSLLGGFVPKSMIGESWRLPVAAALVAAGIALAVFGQSSEL